MKAFILGLALLLAGCAQQAKLTPIQKTDAGIVTAEPVKVKQLTDDQKISLLRAEAHRRNLRWHIYCVEDGFQGSADQKTQPPYAIYIEEGAQPFWIETGTTQAETAYALYQSIQQPPNFQRDHRPSVEHAHKSCPPELHGD